MSNRIGNYFAGVGYKKGDVVALFMESRPEFVCMWLGLNKVTPIIS
jgi:solute carrier family 27 fatty acid transporter 1/4